MPKGNMYFVGRRFNRARWLMRANRTPRLSLTENGRRWFSGIAATGAPIVGTYQAADAVSQALKRRSGGRIGLFRNQPGTDPERVLAEACFRQGKGSGDRHCSGDHHRLNTVTVSADTRYGRSTREA
jgi:hypothetical protein